MENVQIVASNAVIKETCLKRLLLNLRQGQVEPRKDMQRVVFNSFLKATIDQMNEAVKQQGMLVPAKFDYGFKTYYSDGKLPAHGDVPRLTVQVQLVKVLMDMLLQARIAEVVSVERQIFDDTGVTGAAGVTAQPVSEGRPRGGGAAAASTGAAATPFPLEPPDAQGLYTREHFTLSMKATDERLAALLNLLSHSQGEAQPRLFSVVTHLDITGGGLVKVGGPDAEGGGHAEHTAAPAAAAPASEGTGAGAEKPALPKKRSDRVVAGTENVIILLDVDVYRFADDVKEKAKP